MAGEYAIDTDLFLGEAYLRYLDEHPNMTREQRKHFLDKVAKLQRRCQARSRNFRNFVGHSLRLKAMLFARQKRDRPARRYFEKALSVFERKEMLYELGRAKIAFAEFLEHTESDRAAALRKEAIKVFEACNATADLRRGNGQPKLAVIASIFDRLSPTTP